MPYRRSYRRSNYRRRYPRRSTGGTDYIRMAKTAYTGVKYLKSLVNVEKHPIDVNTAVNPNATTGSFTLLNSTIQGDAAGNRQGNSILMKMVNINLKVTMATNATHSTVRMILFWDKECNGSTPVISNLLSQSSVMGNYNHDEATRFPILADKRVTLSVSGNQEMTLRIYRKLFKHTHYDGNVGSIADIVDNALWLFCVSDEGTNIPDVVIRSQVLFIDN